MQNQTEPAQKKRVLVGSPVHQKTRILEEFLNSLKQIERGGFILHFFFVDDNQIEASSQLLEDFAKNVEGVLIQKSQRDDQYVCDERTHVWQEHLIWKVAAFKDLMIQKALEGGYEYLFLVDSDLVLNPHTLEHLISTGKEIISEIYWTSWELNAPKLPQVWVSDFYTLYGKERGEQLSQEEAARRQAQFLEKLQQPGVYEVGGLGACTLISQKALLAGVSFKEIKNISFRGEDRHFCIRAAALGFCLFVDTHYPAYHIYRESDLEGVGEFQQKNGLKSLKASQPVLEPAARAEAESRKNRGEATRKPVLSLCAIVKNERENLPRCLASAKPYVDEMVVVDTGSEDGTPEIAAQYGAKVGYFEWCDDFAAARNYALSLVSGDWILVLDADEELVVESEKFWEEITAQPEVIAYSLIRTEANNIAGMTELHAIRLFRNIPEISYTGRFHEQVKYEGKYISKERVSSLESLRLLHYGNTQENLQEKNINRNIPILERARQEEGISLLLLYCLAGMYQATEQMEKAQECYAEAFDRLMPNLMDGKPPEEFGFIPSLIFILGVQSVEEEDYETARLLCQRGLEWCPNFPPLNYLAGATIRALGFPLGAIAYFENCLKLGREGSYYKGEPFDGRYMTTYPACDMGSAYMNMGRWQEANAAFELALSFDANCTVAQHNLDEIRILLTAVTPGA
jgi:tetratricopeptide (TPR) repeat protein